MADETYEIYALRYGENANRVRSGSFIFEDDHTTPHPLDYFVWLIRNERRTILVDTGFSRATARERGQTIAHEPIEMLKLLGVSPTEITDLVISHLHFDHAGTLPAFEHAQFHLQQTEMAFATGPLICHEEGRIVYMAEHVCHAIHQLYRGKLTYYRGDAELASGIVLRHLPGHTLGVQGVEVATRRGPVILASDASHFYENYRKERLFPLVADAEATYASHRRLKSLAPSGAHVIPGHDPLVRLAFPNHRGDDDSVVRVDLAPDMAVLEKGWAG